MNAGKPVLRCHLLMTDTRKSFLARNQDSLFNGSRVLLVNDASRKAVNKNSYHVSNVLPKCMYFQCFSLTTNIYNPQKFEMDTCEG
jgi:hypothetical protein